MRALRRRGSGVETDGRAALTGGLLRLRSVSARERTRLGPRGVQRADPPRSCRRSPASVAERPAGEATQRWSPMVGCTRTGCCGIHWPQPTRQGWSVQGPSLRAKRSAGRGHEQPPDRRGNPRSGWCHRPAGRTARRRGRERFRPRLSVGRETLRPRAESSPRCCERLSCTGSNDGSARRRPSAPSALSKARQYAGCPARGARWERGRPARNVGRPQDQSGSRLCCAGRADVLGPAWGGLKVRPQPAIEKNMIELSAVRSQAKTAMTSRAGEWRLQTQRRLYSRNASAIPAMAVDV